MNIDLSLRASQLHASAIALHGDVLIQVAGDDLHALDAATLKHRNTWNIMPRQFCFAQNGTLVVFAFRPDAAGGWVYRIDDRGNVETLEGPGWSRSGTTVVLPGPKADEIYVTEGADIVLLRLGGGNAELLPGMAHPAPNDGSRDQLFSRADGSVVGPSREGGIGVVAPGRPVGAYRTPDRYPLHLVAGSQGQIWYSYARRELSWSAAHIVLAQPETPMVELAHVDVSPGRVVHLASGGGLAAALVFDMEAAMKNTGGWTVIVVEESGKVRWRAEIPAAFAPSNALTAGFVAVDEKRVVVAAPSNALMAWDAATGKPVP